MIQRALVKPNLFILAYQKIPPDILHKILSGSYQTELWVLCLKQ